METSLFYNNDPLLKYNLNEPIFNEKIKSYISLPLDQHNKKLDYLIDRLSEYKKDKQSQIIENHNKNINISSLKKRDINVESFKHIVFSTVDKVISEILYMEKEEIRKNKIDYLYNWFNKNYNNYFKISYMNERTKNLPSEKLTELEINQDNQDFLKYFHISYLEGVENNGYEHRNESNFITKPNKLYKEYERKNVFILDEKKLENYDNNKKIFYKRKNLKEVKGSYSYNRPPYGFQILFNEQKINEEKNKLLQEKRSQEEMISMMKNFGRNRAMYKMNINNKYEMRNMIKMYKSQIRSNSQLQKSIIEEDKDDENNSYNNKMKINNIIKNFDRKDLNLIKLQKRSSSNNLSKLNLNDNILKSNLKMGSQKNLLLIPKKVNIN